jgi:signal transduction histidine kinase
MAKKSKAGTFPGQHEGEEVLMVFNQHPLVMRKALIIGMVIILLGTVPLLAWPLSNEALQIAIAAPFLVFAYWFYNWVGWHYSVYIVTNERIVEVRQKGFFNRSVVEFGLDKIQNINYHITGLEAVVLGYGNITVQTYVGELTMPIIHHPVKVHQQLVSIVRQYAGVQVPATANQLDTNE